MPDFSLTITYLWWDQKPECVDDVFAQSFNKNLMQDRGMHSLAGCEHNNKGCYLSAYFSAVQLSKPFGRSFHINFYANNRQDFVA